jgi:hypothetical protein
MPHRGKVVNRHAVLRIAALVGLLVSAAPATAQLIISEFRVRGPNGANDEFIELYNNSGAAHTVAALSGTGYGVAASNGVNRCTVPNGTVIPDRGHFLCVNSVGYSLGSYPAGNGTTATGDATYTTDIPDNAGIAIFNNNSGGASFSLANRMDAVGSTIEANTLYKEGTGYPALTPFSIDYSFFRDICGRAGSITTFGECSAGQNIDTGNNATDFIFVDTNGTSAGAGQRLGAAGPQNLSSPATGAASISAQLLDSCVGEIAAPNRVRTFDSDPANNSTFGTLDLRRTFVNLTGGSITRMRYRIVDLTTFPAPSGIADLRPRTSPSVVVPVDRTPCGDGTTDVTVQGTTLEQPPSQPNGGGFNSTLSDGSITLATPLANGASVDVRFLFGLQQTGCYRVGISVETLPGGGFSPPLVIQGGTDGDCVGPTVTSVTRVDPNPTAAASVDFTVTFSDSVTGVDASDFVVTTTGIAGAGVTAVTGSGATRTVTVATGVGEGTIRLDVIDDDSIRGGPQNLALGPLGPGNGGFIDGEVYDIDRTAPSVTVDQAVGQSDPANASPINFTVVFSEDVIGFAAGDVILGGTAGATTAVVTGGPSTYNVAVSGMSGSGTVTASIAAGVATDVVLNPNTASTSTDNTVTFDNVAPTATINQEPGQTDPATTSPVRFTIAFSEPVVGFTAADVMLGGAANPTTAVVLGGPTSYTIEVSGMTANGAITVNVPAGAATDIAGNPNAAVILIDNFVVFQAFFMTPEVIPAAGLGSLVLLALLMLLGFGLHRRIG